MKNSPTHNLSFLLLAQWLILIVFIGGLFVPNQVVYAADDFTITPVTWNVVGLDSNNVLVGPNLFPVGARVCNNTGAAVTNVTSSFVWDSADSYINIRPGTLTSHSGEYALPSLAGTPPNNCTDFYYEIEITRNSAAYHHTRRYHITATIGATTISTPIPREIFVEHLVSQNRNAVTSMYYKPASDISFTEVPNGGTMFLAVGNTYDIKLVGYTATQGYNQLESFISLNNVLFRVNSTISTYSADNVLPATGGTLDRLYSDACTWDSDPLSPSYRSCIGEDYKRGGNVTNTFNVTILSGSGTSQLLRTLLYDFSGSSFHYNSDFSSTSRFVSIVNAVNFSKSFSEVSSGISTLTFTLVNPTATAVSGISFNDPLPNSPAQMAVATTTSTTSGCGSSVILTAVQNATSISFENGSVSAGGTCTFSVSVTAPTSGVYINITDELTINGAGTGQKASANLSVSSGTSDEVCIDLAKWTIDAQTSSPPAPFIYNVTPATASVGNGLSASIDTVNQSWQSVGWPKIGPVTYTTDPYYQFAINTSGFTSVDMTLDVKTNTTPYGPTTLELYSSTDGGVTYSKNEPSINPLTNSFATYGPRTFTTKSDGITYFRVYAYGAQNTGAASLYIDNILFHGCAVPKLRPTMTKDFSPAAIAVGDASTLTFIIHNPNVSTVLHGVSFSDTLPSGVQVAAIPTVTTLNCGSPTFTPTPGSTNLSFSGGTVSANSDCTVSVKVTASSAGTYHNISGFVIADESGGAANTAADGSASATLTVVNSPTFTKKFSPNPIYAGEISTLTFTLTNSNNVAITAATFTDDLPSGLKIATTTQPSPAASDACAGSFSPALLVDAASFTFIGGTIPANSSCVVQVNVASAVTGNYLNSSESLTATGSGIELTASPTSDTLAVIAHYPTLMLLKQVSTSSSGPWYSYLKVNGGSQVYYRFTIENTGDVPLTSIAVSDPTVNTAGCNFTSPLPVADENDDDHITTCIVGPITASSTLGTYPNTAKARGIYDSTLIESTTSTASYALPAPDLILSKVNSVGGSVTGTSTPFNWNLTVKNSKYGDTATFNSGAIILQDDLPTTATYGPVTKTDGATPPSGTGTVSCSIVTNTLTCTAISGTVILDPDASFTVEFTVTPTAVGDLTNPRSGGICKVDPNNVVQENNEDNNTVSDIVSVNGTSSPDLRVTKSNSTDDAGLVGTPFTWNLTVSNTGTADAVFETNQSILTDDLPSDISYGTANTGGFSGITNSGNISCTISGSPGMLTCSASGASVIITAGGNFTVGFSATPIVAATLVNTATVDPGGHIAESNESNNTASDTVTATALQADLSVSKSNDKSGSMAYGTSFTWTLTGANTGTASATFASGETILSDLLPIGADYGDPGAVSTTGSVTGTISCNNNSGTLACIASGGSVTIGAGSNFRFSITSTPTKTGNLTNIATVDLDEKISESNESNNTVSDTMTITGPSLTLTKSNGTSSVTAGSTTYTLTVSNTGSTATSGTITVVDVLPTGMTITDATFKPGGTNGENWSCTSESNVITCTSSTTIIATSGASVFSFTANVDSGACGTLVNKAQVGGGGDPSTSNPPTLITAGNCSASDIPTKGCAVDSDTADAPCLRLTKTATETSFNMVGDVLHYTITARNDGNVTLPAVSINDPELGSLICDPSQPVDLGPNESLVCTGSHTVDQGDMVAGFYKNTASVTATPPIGDPIIISADKTINLLFDPPLGVKTYDENGFPILKWTIVWINNQNDVAISAFSSDPIPEHSSFIDNGISSGYPLPAGAVANSTTNGVTCLTDPGSVTTTSSCYYEAPTVDFPRGRIIWQGSIGSDLGATNRDDAKNEIVIDFGMRVDDDTSRINNIASISINQNNDEDFDDPGEANVASVSNAWNEPGPAPTKLPETGFAPGRISILPNHMLENVYANYSDLILEIPSLKIKTVIVGIPVYNGSWDVSWLGNSAGWLQGSAFPTLAGNSVITGHVWNADNSPGPFINIKQLGWGDLIIIHGFGQKYVYQVQSVVVIKPDSISQVMTHEVLPWVTLLTCSDFDEADGIYKNRVIIQAVQVGIETE